MMYRVLLLVFSLSLTLSAALAQQDTASTDEAAAQDVAGALVQALEDENVTDPETGLPNMVLKADISQTELEHRLVPLTNSELALLAEEWLKIVKRKTEEVMAAQIAVDKVEGDVQSKAREVLTELTLDRKQLFDKFNSVISAWDKKGGDETAISEYRAYRSAIIIDETRTADTQTLLAQALAWLKDDNGGLKLGKQVGVVVASLLGLVFFGRVVRRLARRWLGRIPNLSKLLQTFLVGVIYWLVLAVGLMVVLSALGVDISPIFALVGGASFIIAFAFQDTLGNLASGMMIMINRPFDEGDYVDLGGTAGTVKSVSIVATTIVTPDNQVIVIPNRNVWGSVITNVTASETRRIDLVFGISYEDSIPAAMKVMEETLRAHPLVLQEPEPTIRVHELADSSVNFVCRPWTVTSDYWTVYWDLMQQVKEGFDAAGISIPYPQRDVHFKPSEVLNNRESYTLKGAGAPS